MNLEKLLKEYLYVCKAKGMTPQTLKSINYKLGLFVREIGVDDVFEMSGTHILDYIHHRQEQGV